MSQDYRRAKNIQSIKDSILVKDCLKDYVQSLRKAAKISQKDEESTYKKFAPTLGEVFE